MDSVYSVAALLTNVVDESLPGVPDASVIDCLSRCFHSPNCPAFFYSPDDNVCRMSDISYSVVPEYALTEKPGSTYYEFKHDGCPSGWSYIKPIGRCFKLFTSGLDSSSAHQSCSRFGGRLVNIYDINQDNAVWAVAQKHGSGIWIGLRKTSAIWRWDQGSDLGDFTGWANNHPTSNIKRCARMSGNTQKWNRKNCSEPRAFLCELVLMQTEHC